jgi:lipopolysaccharide/colanic/teichoic acid biosynthesis glycosyltransferase
MYKFRSMYMDAEKYGPQWAERIDWRCTRVGRFLRKTRLDELPQIWNILRGEMSIVGPRPERAYFYEQFGTYIHGFHNRLVVKPGLTGWAQINGGYDLKPEEKIFFDMEYIEKQSLALDLECILRTVKLIFTHEGAR